MPELHRFHYNGNLKEHEVITLDEASAKHIWQVLRMEDDQPIIVTDGRGHEAIGHVKAAGRYSCDVEVKQVRYYERTAVGLHLCVAFTKNNSRNEWLLEKATELGVSSITPLHSARSEKVHFRTDRWDKLLVSALLQSQQRHLPDLSDITNLPDALKKYVNIPNRFVAHCVPDKERFPLSDVLKPGSESVILIGPEGDFRADEVSLCTSYGYKPVSLGSQRLRTETAAVAVCSYFNLVNDGKV
ncbi:MAG: 16S rRNA (uracil(1498)-N(3))-methyltransferase [Chitinophagia bacterium]|nr:16S rRNA (uracil(1498)-N(3))-methyltransferase [Chitinophagia bacterium]